VGDASPVITGTAEAGSTVEITLPNGMKLTTTADENGDYRVDIPPGSVKAGDVVTAKAIDEAGNESELADTTVIDITPPDAPVIDQVTDASAAITGTAEARSTVEVTLPDGTKLTTTADANEGYHFDIPPASLRAGEIVTAKATDAAGNGSELADTTVIDITPPDAPEINQVTDASTTITGTAEPDSTVEIKSPDGTKLTTTAASNGDYRVDISPGSAKEGDVVTAKATDEAGNESALTKTIVIGVMTPGKPEIDKESESSQPIQDEAEKNKQIGIPKTGSGMIENGIKYLLMGILAMLVLIMTIKKRRKMPLIDLVTDESTHITGKAKVDSHIVITLKDDIKLYPIQSKRNTYSAEVTPGLLQVGDVVQVTFIYKKEKIKLETKVMKGKDIKDNSQI